VSVDPANSGVQYRRSPHLVSYWTDEQLVFHNYATGKRAAGTALTIGLLDYFHDWRRCGPLLAQSTLPCGELRTALRALVASSLLQQSNRPTHPAERAMEAWANWNPAAGFFHFSTKDVPFEQDESEAFAFLAKRAAERPAPPTTKTYRHRPRISLPDVQMRDALARVLLKRRTWRRFGAKPLPLSALSVLMRQVFGAQNLIDLGPTGRAMLRTSPSAGARNPIEAYVVVRSVSGVSPGVYHYAPLEHRLTRLKSGARSIIERHLPGQPFYGKASILVLMTAVFERTDWKYPFARAYRTVLLEAGHFCQTFCLVATALRLAPFCTGALADSLIERDLGLDGVGESVIYACGVGTRPADAEAPRPSDRHKAPLLTRNQIARFPGLVVDRRSG
jgi:SagB-type dehydrogenase family enzyme